MVKQAGPKTKLWFFKFLFEVRQTFLVLQVPVKVGETDDEERLCPGSAVMKQFKF